MRFPPALRVKNATTEMFFRESGPYGEIGFGWVSPEGEFIPGSHEGFAERYLVPLGFRLTRAEEYAGELYKFELERRGWAAASCPTEYSASKFTAAQKQTVARLAACEWLAAVSRGFNLRVAEVVMWGPGESYARPREFELGTVIQWLTPDGQAQFWAALDAFPRAKKNSKYIRRRRRAKTAPGIRLVAGKGEKIMHISEFVPEVRNGRFIAEGGGRQLKEAIAEVMRAGGTMHVLVQFSPNVRVSDEG